MKRTRNGILIPDVPIMASGNLPNAVKGVSAGGEGGFDPSRLPFYIDVRGTVTLDATSGLQMSADGKNWTDTAKCELPTGKTYFRVASDQSSPLKPNWTENENSDYDIGGNINSLVKTTFENDTTSYKFNSYFKGKTKLKSAGNLILPATTLTNTCYFQMFYGCKSLTTTPALPATTMAQECYREMFYGCTSLTTTPALPATTMAQVCYQAMFQYCTSLATAPALPATALAVGCYQAIFRDCTSLTTAPALPATTLTDSCYSSMFNGCKSLTTAPALPATTLTSSCYQAMFNGCKSLTTAPALPATTLTDICYSSMFYGCTSLTTAPALPATTLTSSCYQAMFNGCTNLNYIKCLATSKSASHCTYNWVQNVAGNGTFVKKRGVSWPSGISGLPTGWTVEEID